VFQRLMDFVLCGLSYMTCLVYLDDIIIFGKSFEEQLARLREVFSRIGSANLKLKPTKCSLFRRSVSFLGHIVSEQGISMQTEKIQAIRDWPPCETLTELRAYLGTCGYYRRFVKDFSTIAAPLYALTRKEPSTNGHPSVNEHLKLSSSGYSCSTHRQRNLHTRHGCEQLRPRSRTVPRAVRN